MGPNTHATPEDVHKAAERALERYHLKGARRALIDLVGVHERLLKDTNDSRGTISDRALTLAVKQAEEVLIALREEEGLRQAKAAAERCTDLYLKLAEQRKTQKAPAMTEEQLVILLERLDGGDVVFGVSRKGVMKELEELRQREAQKGPTEGMNLEGTKEPLDTWPEKVKTLERAARKARDAGDTEMLVFFGGDPDAYLEGLTDVELFAEEGRLLSEATAKRGVLVDPTALDAVQSEMRRRRALERAQREIRPVDSKEEE